MREIDWEGLRDDLTLRKAKAIDDLPALVERFTKEAEAVGAKVYRAVDAEEARRIVTAICRAKKAKLVVKSKSMATEEIGLTDHLESQGIHAVETDLGEWIIQLAGERPSHLIAPAIHKTREEVAQLFAKVVGHPVPDDTASLVQVARTELRQSFLDADIGITGGNALIAETGTLMLVTNEGNADLATTLPPVHIAVVGIEKLVPTLDDAVAIVKLLARSGTGQKITSYTQFITGPSRSADIELKTQIGVHGPKELHFVLLDNGRTAMREDPFFRDALRRVQQRLPQLSRGRRPRLRSYLHRPDRPGRLAVAPRDRERRARAGALHGLQRLRHGLPGRDPARRPHHRRPGEGRREDRDVVGEARLPETVVDPRADRPADGLARRVPEPAAERRQRPSAVRND